MSLNFQDSYTKSGVAVLSICLVDPVSGYPVNVVYTDASALSFWQGIENTIGTSLLIKIQTDEKLPSGTIIDTVTTTINTTSSVATTTTNTPVTLTATCTSVLGGSPVGAVTFLDGGETLGTVTPSGGVATLQISTLGVGSHSIISSLAATDGFASSTSSPIIVTITP